MADEEEGASKSDEEMAEEDSSSGEEDESEEESDGEELYEVERIVGMRTKPNGEKLFKVRWQNFPPSHDTWEPVSNLESCLDMVEEFEEQKEQEKKRRSEERRRRMALMAGKILPEETIESPACQDSLQDTTESFLSAHSFSVSSSASLSSSCSDPSSKCTLKDTFWKDLEEGKINLFQTDMYSKVKGQRRAARPTSFKKHFRSRASAEDSDADKSEENRTNETSPKRKNSAQKKGNSAYSKKTSLNSTRTKNDAKRKTKTKTKTKKSVHSKKSEFIALSTSNSDGGDSSSDSCDIVLSKMILSHPPTSTLDSVGIHSDSNIAVDTSHDNSQTSHCDKTNSSDSRLISEEVLSDNVTVENREEKNADENRNFKNYDRNDLSTKKPESVKKNNTDVKDTNHKKVLSDFGEVISYTNELKCVKKLKHRTDSSVTESKGEKKLKLDSDSKSLKHRHKSSSSGKDSKMETRLEPSPKPPTSGKENLGDKHHLSVSALVSGISSVLSSTVKNKSSTSVNKLDSGQVGLQPNHGTVYSEKEARESRPARWKDSSDFAQPLEEILSSSLLPILPENSKSQEKGSDLSFEIELDDIDLDELEQQLTLSPSAQPLELTDEELKQAIFDGDYDLVKWAFAARKSYDTEQPDSMGTKLLMQAVLKGYDDIAELLVCNGAKINAQQKNGSTALMLAAEQAHICTVALLVEMGANINIQQNNGETALMKAVKRGHKQIVRYLLESGANFASLMSSGYSALTFAKLLRLPDVEDIIVDHISRLTSEFDRQVSVTLNNTAQIISALFPLQCFPLNESDKFVLNFKNEAEPLKPGVGFLLFVAHARITSQEIKCRFYGPCAVTAVVLNGVKQPSLTEEANFVLSCHPLLPGKNELFIHTESAPTSKAKLVVCAYKAQLIDR